MNRGRSGSAGDRRALLPKRKGLTPAGLERLRAAASAHRPCEHSTGPGTAERKARSADNGRSRQGGLRSAREVRPELTRVMELTGAMATIRAWALADPGPRPG